MKRSILLFTAIVLGLSACSSGKVVETTVVETTVAETTTNVKETEAAKKEETNGIKESVNKMSQREFAFDPSKKFEYTGGDKNIKAITEDMLNEFGKYYDGQGAVEIPTPYIVKVDQDDKNDIKVYGNFWIYGYQMSGTIFNMKNGGSFPGCYHLKEEDGKVSVVSKEIAEDGSNNWSSLVKICGGDEELAKKVGNAMSDDNNVLRSEYVKMYAKANNLKLSGIKDYGWPIILFDDISDATFLYNFYSSYFDEVREEDHLNDMAERLDNLKKKYMTDSLVNKLDDMTMDLGADAVINAQDVTEQMLDTLKVDDYGNGNLVVNMENGSDNPTKINVKIEKVSGERKITDLSY